MHNPDQTANNSHISSVFGRFALNPFRTRSSLSSSSTTSPPHPPIPSTNDIPIHERPVPINAQSLSPLYNGRIPPEIRDAIFNHVLTEYTKIDAPFSFLEHSNNEYIQNTNFTRPGYTGKKTIDTALLQTCRRIYLETYHLPPVKKEHVFWHARGPPNHPGSSLETYGEQEIRYFERLRPWQLALVKDIHLFTQAFWLEQVFPRMAKRDFVQGIEKVKITIRRGDWWWNESNALLGINPQRGGGDATQMLRDWSAERDGRVIAWDKDGWGCAFTHIPCLKEIELELETSDDKLEELKAIMQKAKTWRFPARTTEDDVECVFSAEGCQVRMESWQSPMCFWSDACPYCGKSRDCTVVDPENKGCTERMRLRKENLGPLCYVGSLKWKIGRKDGGVRLQ